VGPPRSAETSRLGLMDPVTGRGQVRDAWWQEKQHKVVEMSQCNVVAHNRSLHVGLRRVTIKPSGYLVEPQNQFCRLSGWRRDPGASRSLDAWGTWRDRGACIRKMSTALKAWQPDEN
jgi:hypothetical protein